MFPEVYTHLHTSIYMLLCFGVPVQYGGGWGKMASAVSSVGLVLGGK
jgi:hypothetical protein